MSGQRQPSRIARHKSFAMRMDLSPSRAAPGLPLRGEERSNTPVVLLFLLLLAFWLFSRPYQGLWHDAIIYAVQALARLHPEVYAKDLFFLYGSQDDFTLFSPIYVAFIRLLGLDGAMLTLFIAGHALWLGAAMLLANRLLRGFPFWLGLVLVVVMPSDYGDMTWNYADSFLTAKLIAEGLTLLSLALVLQGQRIASILILAVAFAMHPLMALGGAAFIGLYLAGDKPRLVLGAGVLASVAVLLLGWLDVPPFSGLFATMDADWFHLAVTRAPDVFWDEWRHQGGGARSLLAFSLLAVAAVTADGQRRRAFLFALMTGLLALLLFWLGTSVFHNVLLIQLQVWRWLWLTQLFSYLAAAWLVGAFWQRDRTARMLLLGFLAAWLTRANIGGLIAVMASGLFIWHARREQAAAIPGWLARLLYALPVLAAVWWLSSVGLEVTSSALTKTMGRPTLEFGVVWLMLFLRASGGVFAVLIFLAVWRYGADRRKPVHLAAAAGVVFLLMLSLAFWDRRDTRQSYYAHQALKNAMPEFSHIIPYGAVVYWEDDMQMTWFVLGRASYASIGQTVSLIFNRQTAMEGKRRIDRLSALSVKDGVYAAEGNPAALPEKTFAGLVHACHDPALDFVILSKDFGEHVIERHFEKMTGKYFYLYNCAKLRRNFADTWPERADKKTWFCGSGDSICRFSPGNAAASFLISWGGLAGYEPNP